jgi:hypothetical protein
MKMNTLTPSRRRFGGLADEQHDRWLVSSLESFNFVHGGSPLPEARARKGGNQTINVLVLWLTTMVIGFCYFVEFRPSTDSIGGGASLAAGRNNAIHAAGNLSR